MLEETQCLRLQGSPRTVSCVKMQALYSFKMLGTTNQTTQHYILEDLTLQCALLRQFFFSVFCLAVFIWLSHAIHFCLHSGILQLNWTRYLDYIMHNTNVTLDYDSDHLVVMDIDYLQKLAALVSITDQETLGEYILLRN